MYWRMLFTNKKHNAGLQMTKIDKWNSQAREKSNIGKCSIIIQNKFINIKMNRTVYISLYLYVIQ